MTDQLRDRLLIPAENVTAINALLLNPDTTVVNELLKGGASVEYHEFPGVQHDVWVQAYQDENIFKWFDGQVRNPFPNRVSYASRWYKYNAAYWVLFDKLTSGTLATIDARFTGANTLEVKTTDLDAFTLMLKGHPFFTTSNPLMVKINGAALQSAPKLNHSFLLKEGKWIAGKYEVPVVAKKQGLEGPLSEVMTNRVLFVYGTQGSSGNPETMERRALVKQAAKSLPDFDVSGLGLRNAQLGLQGPGIGDAREMLALGYQLPA